MEKMIVRLLTLAALLLPLSANAEDKIEEAKRHVQTGAELYDENNFRAALVEFQRAYELAPSFKIQFNIAQVNMELQDYAGALKAYTRYLKEGGPDVPPDRVTQVNAEIDRLNGRVGKITIQTVAGAEVLIDDVSIGYAPLPEAVVVNAGQRRIGVHPPGREMLQRVYDVAGRQELTVSMALDQATPSTTTTTPLQKTDVVAKPRGPKSKTPVYVTWSMTGAFAIGAVTFATLARGDSNKLATERDTFGVTHQQLEDQKSKTVRDAAIADGLFAATLVTAGIATYFTLTRTGSHAKTETAVRVQVGPGSLGIAGAF